MPDETVYIYALKDPETRRIRYIGKADCLKKRLACHLVDKCRCHRTNWISELKTRGLLPELEILATVPKSEWPAWEIKFIATARAMGMDLTNQTIGGESPMEGKKQSAETIAKRVAKLIGQKRSQESCDRIGAAGKGKKVSEEGRKNMSAAQKNRAPFTKEHREKLSRANTGKKMPPVTPETREKMRASRIRFLEEQKKCLV